MFGKKNRSEEDIRKAGFEILVLDPIIIHDDYHLKVNITPDQLMKFNDMLISIYKEKGLLNYYLQDLDDYLDSLFFFAIFDDNLDVIDFNYFLDKMTLLFSMYGHEDITSYDFYKEKEKLLEKINTNIIDIEPYLEYKKILKTYG